MKNSRLAWISREHQQVLDPAKIITRCPRCNGPADQAAAEDESILSKACDNCFSSLSEEELNYLGMHRPGPERAAHYGIY